MLIVSGPGRTKSDSSWSFSSVWPGLMSNVRSLYTPLSTNQRPLWHSLTNEMPGCSLSLSPVTLMATKQSEAKFSVNSKLEGTFCSRLIVRWNKRLGYFHIYCFCPLRTTLYDIYELCKSDVFKFYFILSTNGDIGNSSALCVGLFITIDNGNVIVRFYWPEVSR